MARPFAQLGFVLDQFDDLQRGECAAEQVCGVEVRQCPWAACLVLQLLGRIALKDQQATRFQRSHDIGEEPLSHLRVSELDEHRDDDIVSIHGPWPFIAASDKVGHRHPCFVSQPAGLGHACLRHIECLDVQALVGKPDTVAPFAVGDA